MLLVKLIVVLLLLSVVVSLFTGLAFLVKDKGSTKRTVNALTVRIILSIVAIIVIIIASATGILTTNSAPF
ncbi:MAG: twin transmembrane helix small protein [Gammaproteobacteria bacterium]|nr:twin transmembrane helix small protein [Gammaproteobacteria bacterium]